MTRRVFIHRLRSGIMGMGALVWVNGCMAPLISEAQMADAPKKLGA